jgi:small subunit ribosomal protein S16
MGKKRQHYFRVVVADQRAKRDGGFLETLGSYDPHSNPPSITLNEESAKAWLSKGAQPSDAAEKILRRVGVIEGGAIKRPMVEPKAAPAAPVAEAPAAPAPAEAPAEPEAIAEEAPAEEAAAEEAPAETTEE